MPARGLFVTGTDTGVGKTWIGTRLARSLRAAGIAVRARKPVESGCERRHGALFPLDGAAYHEALNASEALEIITPYRLAHALSPARAARLEGVDLTLQRLEAAAREGVAENEFLLVEGAGGFYSPLALDGSNADLAARLGLALLLVAPDRLGVINHVLLTREAAARRGLAVAAVVLNRLPGAEQPGGMDNRAELASHLDCPVHPVAGARALAPDSALVHALAAAAMPGE